MNALLRKACIPYLSQSFLDIVLRLHVLTGPFFIDLGGDNTRMINGYMKLLLELHGQLRSWRSFFAPEGELFQQISIMVQISRDQILQGWLL
ncbi:MAG: hypothetical protein B7Z37_25055 [Verrucomicrobia bacterium 12-59-8]|nr:MAG: hypothetical protein B7Z37_25055 [Verrucomicrobia bacterium 12-59-8]